MNKKINTFQKYLFMVEADDPSEISPTETPDEPPEISEDLGVTEIPNDAGMIDYDDDSDMNDPENINNDDKEQLTDFSDKIMIINKSKLFQKFNQLNQSVHSIIELLSNSNLKIIINDQNYINRESKIISQLQQLQNNIQSILSYQFNLPYTQLYELYYKILIAYKEIYNQYKQIV